MDKNGPFFPSSVTYLPHLSPSSHHSLLSILPLTSSLSSFLPPPPLLIPLLPPLSPSPLPLLPFTCLLPLLHSPPHLSPCPSTDPPYLIHGWESTSDTVGRSLGSQFTMSSLIYCKQASVKRAAGEGGGGGEGGRHHITQTAS